MEDCIKINKITKKGQKIEYDYEIKGKWKDFLNKNEKMFIEYNTNIESVPDGLSIIPLLCNILPISWFFNLEICVDTIDKSFYECIDKVKEGYAKMYPQVIFQGNLKVNIIEENKYDVKNVATLFSGGVDSLNTLIQHIDEKPALLTVWGSDVKLTDEKGWDKVNEHSKFVANYYDLGYAWVKTNFRTFLNTNNLTIGIREKVNGGWWHEFQHGIGILGLFAPIAYINKYKSVYIASSLQTELLGKYTCASDPTIDNYLRFGNCKIIHDGCEFSRQEKIKNICNHFNKESKVTIPIRVCWQSEGGDNCCECEKCYRTILGLMVEGRKPEEFGFNLTEEKRKKMMKKLRKIENVKYNFQNYYLEIQDALLKRYNVRETPKDLIWFRNFKFKNKKPKYKLIAKKIKNDIRRKIRRMN